jgi:hypothetical protein
MKKKNKLGLKKVTLRNLDGNIVGEMAGGTDGTNPPPTSPLIFGCGGSFDANATCLDGPHACNITFSESPHC